MDEDETTKRRGNSLADFSLFSILAAQRFRLTCSYVSKRRICKAFRIVVATSDY